MLGIDSGNLMGRVLGDLLPAMPTYDVLKAAREGRTAGIRTAVLSNSLGREPFDPYGQYDLERNFDVAALSLGPWHPQAGPGYLRPRAGSAGRA